MTPGLLLAVALAAAANPIAAPAPTAIAPVPPGAVEARPEWPAAPVAPLAAAPADPRARFDAARAALVAGDLTAAERGFADVAIDPAATAGLAEAARILAQTCGDLNHRGLVLREPGAARPALDRTGRGQLGWFTTIYGVAAANTAGAIAGVDDSRVFVGLTVAGAMGGLGLSLAATREGPVSRGRAAAIQTATIWSAVNAGALSAIGGLDGEAGAAVTLATSAVAYASALVATRAQAPSEGSVSLTSSGGLWGLAAGALALTFLDDASGETVGWFLLGGADLGLVAGASLARSSDVSRSRVLAVDAMGLLGALAGAAVPAFASSDDPSAYGAATLAGITGGLALGAYWTRGWEDETAARAEVPAPFATRLSDGTLVAGVTGRF